MAKPAAHRTDYGAWLLVAAAAAGLIVSVFNYFWPGNGINHTAGALLVVVSSTLVLGAALVIALDHGKGVALRVFLNISTCLGLLGTGLAAYFLEAHWLLALMALGLLGWLGHMLLGPPEQGRVGVRQGPSRAVR